MSVQYQNRIAYFLISCYVVWVLLHLIDSLRRMGAILDYSEWGLSDMLINYQAGFVRRGLLGEALFQIYQIIPFNVGLWVLAIIVISALLCFSLLFKVARNLSYSPVFLISGFTLQFMALSEVIGIRRDYITLLMCFLSFYLYREWIRSEQKKYWSVLLCIFSMIIAALLHEGSWFYTFPILALHYFFWNYRHKHLSCLKSLLRCGLFALPLSVVMAALFLCKGNLEVASGIWQSWHPLFEQFPLMGTTTPALGSSVYCLSCSTMDFVTGCSQADWGLVYWGWLPMFPFTLALFPALLYLVTRANVSQFRLGYTLHEGNHIMLTSIMLIQLIAMLPFFLFLSCDYGRLFCYWIISSIFAYWVFREDQQYFPQFIHHWSSKFQVWINRVPFLVTPLGYATILLLTPCNMVGGAALGAIPIWRMAYEIPSLLLSLFINIGI